MMNLGQEKRILGMDITSDRKKGLLTISQARYASKVLKRFGMENSKSVNTPIAQHFKLSMRDALETEMDNEYMSNKPYSQAVGSLMYLMVCTRPDLAYSSSLLSRFMSNPGRLDWKALQWTLRYLKGIAEKCLHYNRCCKSKEGLEGYVDSNFARDMDKRRSLKGYVFMLNKNTISWKATLQLVVALSTTEAEYIAAVEGVKEAL